MERLDTAPAGERALEWMDGQSRQRYRNACIHAAEGRLVNAVGSAALAVALNPAFSLPRIKARINRTVSWRMAALRRRVARLVPGTGGQGMHEVGE